MCQGASEDLFSGAQVILPKENVLNAVEPSTWLGWHRLPTILTVTAAVLLLWHGPIHQPADYNNFADQSVLFGIAHAGDVLSNLGFALVAVWGWAQLRPKPGRACLGRGWIGYRLFLIGLLLTAVGSAYYHLDPNNGRLVWDRLPIALAAAGLLAAVRAESRTDTHPLVDTTVLSGIAVLSVLWWRYTDRPQHPGDLGPYLLLQLLPLVLVPLWQWIDHAPRADRVWFGVAVLLYVFAKVAELFDHEGLATMTWMSGHTLKHLLASAAAGVLVGRLSQRLHELRPSP